MNLILRIIIIGALLLLFVSLFIKPTRFPNRKENRDKPMSLH